MLTWNHGFREGQDEPACQYLGQRSFCSKITAGHTDTHNRSLALPGPLKWSVIVLLINIAEFIWQQSTDVVRTICTYAIDLGKAFHKVNYYAMYIKLMKRLISLVARNLRKLII